MGICATPTDVPVADRRVWEKVKVEATLTTSSRRPRNSDLPRTLPPPRMHGGLRSDAFRLVLENNHTRLKSTLDAPAR